MSLIRFALAAKSDDTINRQCQSSKVLRWNNLRQFTRQFLQDRFKRLLQRYFAINTAIIIHLSHIFYKIES